MVKEEIYKGFKIEFNKYPKGFNSYGIRVSKIKNKGFREEEYILETLLTYTSKKSEALNLAKNFIDEGEHRWKFKSQGLSKAEYLPSVNDAQKIKVVLYKWGEFVETQEIDKKDLQDMTQLSSDDLLGFNLRNEDNGKNFYAEENDIEYSDDEGTGVKYSYGTTYQVTI